MRLAERLDFVHRLVIRHSDRGHKTAVLVFGQRILAFRDDNPLVNHTQKSHGAILVGMFPRGNIADHADLRRAVDFILSTREQISTRRGHVRREPGGRPIGTSHPRSTLDDDLVRVIRKAHDEEHMGYKQIETVTGVPWLTVRDVCTMRTWRHVRTDS